MDDILSWVLIICGYLLLYFLIERDNASNENESSQRRTGFRKTKNKSFEYNGSLNYGYLTQEEFDAIAVNAKRKMSRICSYAVTGPVVRGTVRSESGFSEWEFTIDFNDNGRFTGKYAIRSENSDSNIPEKIAERIKLDALSLKYMKWNNATFWTENTIPKHKSMPVSSEKCIGQNYKEVEKLFKDAGFQNILLVPKDGVRKIFDWNWQAKDELVSSVSVSGDEHYSLKQYPISVPIVITYTKYRL